MRKLKAVLSPTNWIYVLTHLCLLLLGFYLASRPESLSKGIGSSLIAAGIAGWVVLAYVLQSQELSSRVKIVTEFGFRSAFEGRSVRFKNEYDSRLSKASKQIDIMGFGLKTLRQDYRNDFKVWKGRCNVRILLIDPDYPVQQYAYSEQRDREEMDAAGSIKEDVAEFIKTVEPFVGREGDRNFEVKLYSCLPSVNLFRVDDELFWGPYLINQQSRNSPTFIVTPGPMFKMLTDHFDAIWNSQEWSHSPFDKGKGQPA